MDRWKRRVLSRYGISDRLVANPAGFHFSDTWQLVMNTVTNVVTYLMVFLIQRSQNKDSRAVHMKLNELVAAIEGASNRLISAENLTEHELATLSAYYDKLTTMAAADDDLAKSHSIEDAKQRHTFKVERRRAERRIIGRMPKHNETQLPLAE